MIPSWTPRYKLHEGDRESIGAGVTQRIITDRWPDHTMTVPVNTAWIFTGHYAMNVPNGFIGQIGIQLSDTTQTNNTLQAACTVELPGSFRTWDPIGFWSERRSVRVEEAFEFHR